MSAGMNVHVLNVAFCPLPQGQFRLNQQDVAPDNRGAAQVRIIAVPTK
jgi:hypothetical protein